MNEPTKEGLVENYWHISSIEDITVYASPYFPELKFVGAPTESFDLRYDFNRYDQPHLKPGSIFLERNYREVWPSGRLIRVSERHLVDPETLSIIQTV